MRIKDELKPGADELYGWASEMGDKHGFFIEADEAVQLKLTEVADFVEAAYLEPPKKAEFLKGADPWLIAHAKVDGGCVVTREKLVGGNSSYPKIPNLCTRLDVQYVDLFEMMKAIGLKL